MAVNKNSYVHEPPPTQEHVGIAQPLTQHTPGPWRVFFGSRRYPGVEATGLSVVIFGREGEECGVRGDTHETALANARLIAAAPDHALIGWAMCVQDGRWEEWSGGKGEFCFAGLRHATKLDEFGCPVLTDHLRQVLEQSRANTTPENPHD